jgi:hypothetical protein
MFSSFVTGVFFFMQQHGYALHSIIMHFIRDSYLGSYNGMHVSRLMARTVLLREPGRHTWCRTLNL